MAELMAIINTTQESIDAGQRSSQNDALSRIKQAFADGAFWADIGGQATNPWATEGSLDQEWSSLESTLGEALDVYPGRISLDTFRPEIARRALAMSRIILNDVTMFHDQEMIDLAVEHQTICIVSHLPESVNGNIAKAHENPVMLHESDVLRELLNKRRHMINAGVLPKHIILDPGIGFGKTSSLNYRLLQFGLLMKDEHLIEQFDPEALDEPKIECMIGHSQKRIIAEHFGGDKTDKDANLAAGRIALNSGASYLRVHDVHSHWRLLTQMKHQSNQ